MYITKLYQSYIYTTKTVKIHCL